MSKKMTIPYRMKFYIDKRISPINERYWDAKSALWGYRKKKYVTGDPIDMGGKQHIHVYTTLYCHLDCYFCQNKFYTHYAKPSCVYPKFKHTDPEKWANWLNRMYNVHHIDFNGGEPFNYGGMIELLNKLDHHNITIFSNLPPKIVPKLKEIDTDRNNIQLAVSFHYLDEPRSIYQFAQDFHKIPKKLKPVLQVIEVPEISGKQLKSAFTRWGISNRVSSAFTPTDHNKINAKDFKRALCHSDMDCIAPDLTVYPCLGMMLRQINPVHISEYKFTNDPQWCDYYGLCGPCTQQKDVYEIK